MTAPLLTDLLAVAVQAAREAGRIHQQYAGRSFEVRSKTTFSDLVTEVDALAEAAIRAVVADRYPDHAVLGEEEGQQGEGEYRWVVDPLDGTVNYAHGFPVYCSSVAVEHHGQRLAGAVYDPTRDELFTATLGGGAHLNGAAIHVSTTASLRAPALISTGFPYDPGERRFMAPLERLLAGGVPLRRPGAAALDLCYVACGRLDGYWEIGLKPWDSAAGALIVTEAGGLVSDVNGHPGPHGEMLVAANERVHPELLSVLRGDG